MKQNNWFDPFYIQSHLSEDELRIQENVREFCEKELKPNVIEMNRKNQFNILEMCLSLSVRYSAQISENTISKEKIGCIYKTNFF